jgi:hypothetical protein
MTVFAVLEPRLGSMSRAFITEFAVLEERRGFRFRAFTIEFGGALLCLYIRSLARGIALCCSQKLPMY